ncbi:MAG: GTP cyclohydrolase I [Alphaproteobacteria bacterium]|nr:GTP cyclohydrolase I [Alphaproteobacteria bacterium]
MNFANENKCLTKKQLDDIQKKVTKSLQQVLKDLQIDTVNDHNTKETAHRIAKMWVHEKFKGRYIPAPKITIFPNIQGIDQLMTIGPINVKSVCSHHFVDFTGKCWIGILPGKKLIGLSKYARIVDWFSRRPQIQEELTAQITKWIENNLKPRGVAVVIRAKHACCSSRGIEDTDMEFLTTEIRGAFREDDSLKHEFYEQIKFTDKNRF